MRYLVIGLIIIIAVIGFMVKHNNNKRETMVAQQEAYKVQQELNRVELERQRIQREAQATMKQQHYAQIAAQATAIQPQNVSTTIISDPVSLAKDPLITRIEEKIKFKLKDPQSAVFRNQRVNCGEVNAKNSFGGYIGFERYIYYSNTDHVLMESSASDAIVTPSLMTKLWEKECGY